MSPRSPKAIRSQPSTFRREVRCKRITILVLALAMSLPATVRPSPTIGPGDMAAMMRAMLVMGKMWNSMFGDGAWDFATSMMGGSSPIDGLGSFPMSGGSFGSMMGMTDPMSFWSSGMGGTSSSMMPWQGAIPGMSGASIPFGMPWAPGAGHAPWGGGGGATPRGLQGTWIGVNDTLLMIEKNRFMLYVGEQLAGIGTLKLNGQTLMVRDAISRQGRAYRLSLRGGMMTWTERGGRTQRFRRVTR